MAQHDQTPHHQTVTVSSMSSPMAPHQQQQQPSAGSMQQQANTNVSSMPSLQNLPQSSQHPQQISTEWGHSRVQVIQQPLQNSTYLQQLYNAQGPLLMPGNIALHPGINSQQIQVIAAGKPFQGNQLAPHMLTTQGKQVLQGQTASAFPGYTTIPTTHNQTFVFSPLGVINSQASLLSAQSQPTVSGIGQQQKNTEMQKVMSGGKVTQGKVVSTSGTGGQSVPAQCVQVSQPVLGTQQPPQAQIISPLQAGGQAMQFAPWQLSGALPQMWAGGLPTGTLPAGGLLAPNPIFIRGTQPDAPSMFIQHSPQNTIQQNNANPANSTGGSVKPRASTDGMAKTPRPISNILPGGLRPAASVSTQTIAGQQPNQVKPRGKPGVRSPAPTSKQDAANQTNKVHHQMPQPKPQLLVMNSAGQMTPLTSSAADKAVLNKAMQQQTFLQQQHQAMQQQQQQQQQQLLQQQQQQLVQHYQQQGMTLGMPQATLPVGTVAQANLMAAAIPQTISMVQQIHPHLVGSALAQTSVSLQQPQTLSQNTISGLALDGASLLSAPLVQVSPILQHEVSSNTVVSPQLTLQTAQGTVGLITAPMHSSMIQMSAAAPLVANIKNEDSEKPSEPASSTTTTTGTETEATAAVGTSVSVAEGARASPRPPTPATPAPAPAVITTDAAVSTTVTNSAAASSMPDRLKESLAKVSITRSEATSTPPRSPASVATSTHTTAPTTPHATSYAATHTTSHTTLPTASSAMSKAASLQTTKATPLPSSQSTSASVAHTAATASTVSVSSTFTTSVTSSIVTPTSSSPLFKTSHSSTRHMSQTATHDKGLPKAMVKPNILTHVIEGYVIQEAGEPFAVNRPVREWIADKDQDKENKLPTTDEPPRKKQMLESMSSSGGHSSRASASSEGASGSGTGKAKASAASGSSASAEPGPPPKAGDDAAQPVPNANKWSVGEVCEFIRKIPGCAGYADEFLMQEVDGEALLLIRPEHLVMALSMKLGPALKIVACIDSLRPDADQPPHEQD